jgi:hypothetical protein
MKKLFIDLEETIIDDIDICTLLWGNVEAVLSFIRREEPDAIETFSFALLGPQEISNWKAVRQDCIPEMRTQTFDIKQLKLSFLRAMLGRVEESEMFDFIAFATKDRVFEWMIQRDFTEGEFILIDDTVKTHTLTVGKLTIRVINVADL